MTFLKMFWIELLNPIEMFWEYFWLPMHYEQQETLLTPPEINGLEFVSFWGMEDVNAKSSLTPQIAGPGPVVFSSLQKNPWQELSFFQSSNFQESSLHISLFFFDGLSHRSKCRPLAGMWARRVCKPNGLCLEQQQMNNEIQQWDEIKKDTFLS